jgi:hypothetical protein
MSPWPECSENQDIDAVKILSKLFRSAGQCLDARFELSLTISERCGLDPDPTRSIPALFLLPQTQYRWDQKRIARSLARAPRAELVVDKRVRLM